MGLRRLLPMVHDDFVTADKSTQHMSQCKQDTMDLILAWEWEVASVSLPNHHLHREAYDEANSHCHNPGSGSHSSSCGRIKCDDQEPTTPSSTGEAAATPPSLDTLPKLQWQKAMSCNFGKKQKSPPMMPAATIITLASVSDMTWTRTTHNNPNNNSEPPIVVASDSDSDASDASQVLKFMDIFSTKINDKLYL